MYAAIASAALLYVLIRVFTVGITYDEAWTIDGFVPQKPWRIFTYNPCSANNHLLNTLLIKVLFLSHIRNYMIARIPSFAAYLFYLFFAYKIGRSFRNQLMGIVLFFLLLANPFLLDFFGLARGYGLSLGFQMTSLYFYLQFVQHYRTRSALYSISAGALAVLSNFSWLNYFVPFVFLLNVFSFLYNPKKERNLVLFSTLVIVTGLAAIIYIPLKQLQLNDALYYGGSNDLYTDTLISLTKYTRYTHSPNNYTYYTLNIFLLFLLSGVVFAYLKKAGDDTRWYVPLSSILLLLTLCTLSVVIQHFLIKTLYPIDRTALFFYPLIILVLCYSYATIRSVIARMIPLCIAMVFGINLFIHANVYKTALWDFDGDTPYIMHYLNEQGKKAHRKISVDCSWIFASVIVYDQVRNMYPYVSLDRMNNKWQVNEKADYYIYLNRHVEKTSYRPKCQQITYMKKDTVLKFSNEDVYLFNNVR